MPTASAALPGTTRCHGSRLEGAAGSRPVVVGPAEEDTGSTRAQ
jgi:hypothetical protein